MALFFDVETTGLPLCESYGSYPKYTDVDKYQKSRIVQFSYGMCQLSPESNLGPIGLINNFIVKPGGFQINNSNMHKITNEIAENKGYTFEKVANKFYEDLKNVKVIVAHNIEFDINVLKSELFRNNLNDIIYEIEKKIMFCTMNNTKSIVNIWNKYGLKDPSLAELYKCATGKILSNAHNSEYDVLNMYASIVSLLDEHKLTFPLNKVTLPKPYYTLSKLSVKELQKMCKDYGMVKYSHLVKHKLVERLENVI